MLKGQRFPKGLAGLLAAQFAGLASGLLFAAVSARTLSAVDFGLLAVWQAVLGYGVVLAEFGTAHVGPRRLAAATAAPQTVAHAVWRMRGVGVVLAIITTPVAFVFACRHVEVPHTWLVLLIAMLGVTAANREWWFLGHHDEKRVAIARGMRHLVVGLGAFALFASDVSWLAPGIFVVGATVHAGLVSRRRPWANGFCDPAEVRSLVRECWPLALALLGQQLLWSGPLVLAVAKGDRDDFGGLAIGYRCYAAGLGLLAAYAVYLLPRTAAAHASSSVELNRWLAVVRRRAWILTGGLTIGALLTWIAIPLVFGRAYPLAAPASAAYVVALVPVVWRIAASNTLVALGYSGRYCVVSLLSGLGALGIGLVMPAEWRFAPIVVTAIGEIVFAFVSYLMLRRILPVV